MSHGWSSIFDDVALLHLFPLGTQWVLACFFASLFAAVHRVAQASDYGRSWRWAWLARAVALTAIVVRFGVPLSLAKDPSAFNASIPFRLLYALYLCGKLLACWWLLSGTLKLTGQMPRLASSRWIPALMVLVGVGSGLAADDVLEVLIFQCPVVVATSLATAASLLRLPAARRGMGSRLSTAAFLAQALLWGFYFVAFQREDSGPWPEVRTFASVLAAHNSYFDLSLDVLTAFGLLILLLQDIHLGQLRAEAERSRLASELQRNQKLRSLGNLVSGVAHELNNPLGAILGYSEVLCTESGGAERVRHAEIIREQALRCRRIVRGLSTFSGKGSEVLERVVIAELIERVRRGFEFDLSRSGVRIEAELQDSPNVIGDRFALEQLLVNLVSNAIQASPRGGCVTVRARALAGAVELAVEDQGPGIAAEVRERIFDPFFTTRETGSGMGLGLAVAHGIVEAHEGSIRVEAGDQGGARFVVTLPVRERRVRPVLDPLPVREIPRPEVPSRPRVLRLLVIEDENLLREMIVLLGRRRGWSVRAVARGDTALTILREETPRFDAVLCDLRIPGPSGIEIHDLLAREDPALLETFLFITGDLGSEEAAAFALRCTRPILRKPIGIHELSQAVEGLASARP